MDLHITSDAGSVYRVFRSTALRLLLWAWAATAPLAVLALAVLATGAA